ncbi:MAG TPA: hypothetical protein VGE74_07080 [Gemmata sp.]
MIGTERRFFVEKCAKLLQDVLVEIRALSYEEGRAQQINDLADLAHNVPEFLTGGNDYVLTYLRAGLVSYARKHHPDLDPEQHRFVRLFDMDEATFTDLCRGPWVWHEPTTAAS